MTIDEAIEHAKEVARTCDDGQCAADHIQLAEWLRQARGADKAARWYTAKIRELKAENAKLRELIKDMWRDIPKSEACAWDSSANTCIGSDSCIGECSYWYRMRELEIEVDDE